MGKDFRRIVNMTANWGVDRQVLKNKVLITPEHGYVEPYELRHLNEALGTRRLGHNRKRNRNGGGTRNFHYYGNDGKADFRKPRRIFTDDYAGKSSRRFQRLKRTWTEEEDVDGY